MQVRPRQMQLSSVHSRPISTLAVLALPVLFIFFWSVLLNGEEDPSSKPAIMTYTLMESSKHHEPDRPTILYEKVSAMSDDEVVRYGAFVKRTEGKPNDKKRPLSIRRWAELMTHDNVDYSSKLANDLTQVLRDSSFPAFRFETKGCHQGNMDVKQFEFVLVKDAFLSSFAARADSSAFAEHFTGDNEAAVVFSNLGGTAVLIAPQPIAPNVEEVYGHCANFVRKAPISQIANTWRMVVQTFLSRVEERKNQTVWFSTAGTGMAWLHFRMDDRPKYYHYVPFKEEY